MRIGNTIRAAWGISLAFLLLAPAAGSPPSMPPYTLDDLGDLGGGESQALGISEAGMVVGRSALATGAMHPFASDRRMADLGTLTGGTSGQATDVNELGQVVGHGGINGYGPPYPQITQGFIVSDGTMQPVGALHCPCSVNRRHGYSEAHAINALGEVVGFSEVFRCGGQHAFLWREGVMQDIGGGAGDPSYSRAWAINDAGQVTGDIRSRTDCSVWPHARAFLWDDGVMRDLGTLDGHSFSTGTAINQAGQVAGLSGDGPVTRAVLWDAGTITDLGALPGDVSSEASDINDAGQVVGFSSGADPSAVRAFLWQDGVMHDLNDLITADARWVLMHATGINDAGEIAGYGLRDGRMRAWLLRPRGLVHGASNPLR